MRHNHCFTCIIIDGSINWKWKWISFISIDLSNALLLFSSVCSQASYISQFNLLLLYVCPLPVNSRSPEISFKYSFKLLESLKSFTSWNEMSSRHSDEDSWFILAEGLIIIRFLQYRLSGVWLALMNDGGSHVSQQGNKIKKIHIILRPLQCKRRLFVFIPRLSGILRSDWSVKRSLTTIKADNTIHSCGSHLYVYSGCTSCLIAFLMSFYFCWIEF